MKTSSRSSNQVFSGSTRRRRRSPRPKVMTGTKKKRSSVMSRSSRNRQHGLNANALHGFRGQDPLMDGGEIGYPIMSQTELQGSLLPLHSTESPAQAHLIMMCITCGPGFLPTGGLRRLGRRPIAPSISPFELVSACGDPFAAAALPIGAQAASYLQLSFRIHSVIRPTLAAYILSRTIQDEA